MNIDDDEYRRMKRNGEVAAFMFWVMCALNLFLSIMLSIK